MKRIINYILWLIFPRRCAVCSKLISKDDYLCENCSDNLERINKCCKVCGSDKKQCVCKRRVFHFAGATAVFNHGEFSKEIINNFKFRGNGEIADYLAGEMANRIKTDFEDISFDAVTAVPMHRFKKFIKGFNHSEILARKISDNIGVQYINALHKHKNKTQHKLSYSERRENVKGAFTSNKLFLNNILLVDDIKTTGATLDECARMLMFAGVRNVYCVTAISNNYRKQTVEK